MSGILRLESLTKGNTLKQGDKTPLKYRLFDADGEKLNIAGKSAQVRLVYPDFLTIGYEKDGLTVAQDDTVTFTIDNVIPARIYHVEIIVDGTFIFPSRADESKFTVDKSSFGTETNIIEIVGVDAVVRKAVDLINKDPSLIIDEDKLVNDIISNTGIGSIEEYHQQFNDVIKELSEEKDYHSLPEIAGARGGHDTLGQRLDNTIAKGEVNINHFDEATRQAFLEAQGIDVNYILGEGNVAPRNTTFFKTGKNLFDKSKALDGVSVSSATGGVLNLADYSTSDYIPVIHNTVYTRSHTHTMAFYDANKVFISGVPSQPALYTFTTPSNAVFLRTSFPTIAKDYLQLELGENETTYEPYKEFIPSKLVEVAPFDITSVGDGVIPPNKTTFFKRGKNMFDKTKATLDHSVQSTTGNIVPLEGYFTSDFIPVLPDTTYHRSNAWTLAFYTINKVFISGISGLTGQKAFTTPPNTAFIRSTGVGTVNGVETLQIELGSVGTPYENFGWYFDKSLIKKSEEDVTDREPKFTAEFTSAKIPLSITDATNPNLALIATKTIQNGDALPDTVGYLYLNESTQKVYYSKGTFDKAEFLFDWDLTLSENVHCREYHASITKDGDVIFLRNWFRRNPIIYPANNYSNPYVVDFGTSLKPYGYLNSTGVGHHPTNDYFIFGEYTPHTLEAETNNDPRNIWKVSKPYNDPNNWKVVQSFKHVYYSSPVSDRPDIEIGHIHTVTRDFISGAWYSSTGDIDRHCRVWESLDEGESWTEVAVNGQRLRALGMIFTKDSAYWGTDAHYAEHALYKLDRNSSTGILDFSTLRKIVDLDLPGIDGTQPTYATCYVREPNGLLFLCRAEPRADHKLDLLFWSFKYDELFKLGTYNRVPNASEQENRHGFGNQVSTQYQPTAEDGIITGGGSVIRQMTLDLLNHRTDNVLGNIKIKVVEI